MHQVCLALITLAFAVLAWAAHSVQHERWYLVTAWVLSLSIAATAAIEVAARIHTRAGEFFGLLTVYRLGIYFLAGILYHAALQANVVMVVAFMPMLLFLREPPRHVAEHLKRAWQQTLSVLSGDGVKGGQPLCHHAGVAGTTRFSAPASRTFVSTTCAIPGRVGTFSAGRPCSPYRSSRAGRRNAW